MKDEKYITRGVVEQILAALAPSERREIPDTARIDVHAAVSRFAVLYERIRNAVDYKDDHLLRKAAIVRILKRQLLLESNPIEIATNLVRELIGACYLPNNELPETLIGEVAERVRKYQAVERARVGSTAHLAWLRRIISAEIDEVVVETSSEQAWASLLYERLADRVHVREAANLPDGQGKQIDDQEFRLQLYMACMRLVMKSDDDMIGYNLLRAYLPEWQRSAEWIDAPKQIAERLLDVERRIRQAIENPLAPKLQRAIKPWAVSFVILRDAARAYPAGAAALLADPVALANAVTERAERQMKTAKRKLRRGAIRAIIYIFLTKMLIAFALELPLEKVFYGDVHVTALLFNLLFPPFLMFLVALFIRVPGKENASRIQEHARTFLTAAGVHPFDIRLRPHRGWFGTLWFGLAYATLYVLIFGLITLALLRIHFTWVSILVFLFFLCTVSFFAFRLRQNAREQVIVNGRERLRSVLIDIVSLPILRVGSWLSRGISRINVFLFFFDILLEAPFKLFLSVLEEWFSYLREKREEL
ncbi:MAG: hypothetical protein AAB879_00620 [Patescibacteria group bacterium]